MNPQKIMAQILAMQTIPRVNSELAQQLDLKPSHHSIGLVTLTIDDVAYVALDEATKKADVDVVYAKSFYAGAAHASGPLSGEVIGIIAGSSPDEIRSGLDAIQQKIQFDTYFEAINNNDNHALFAHTVASCGTYLAEVANVKVGTPLAYLIAPPLEAVVGLDVALKAADVELKVFFGPPSETNFGGGLLSGSQSSCEAAANAFREAIEQIARNPVI
ncbi:ethanolamine utilization microcompartment protein EutL [Lysinibacillus macroides]|uniref:Ethanolamine utilization protein EutL n=1 Tax=Lysinibacillus macroides TaxID=33935 RepID=A0A0N0CV36_9BACI|nr:ethanolamine utilization microcompartment protein EutL [Lysinibacillus macroides]KOY80814.1 ethanolamine utilization protein EutL [Lysinibacillus macroides]QPR69957.1 ethanolamine utilization microcompartment protein EutL [Lysinibacillus macroides]